MLSCYLQLQTTVPEIFINLKNNASGPLYSKMENTCGKLCIKYARIGSRINGQLFALFIPSVIDKRCSTTKNNDLLMVINSMMVIKYSKQTHSLTCIELQKQSF